MGQPNCAPLFRLFSRPFAFVWLAHGVGLKESNDEVGDIILREMSLDPTCFTSFRGLDTFSRGGGTKSRLLIIRLQNAVKKDSIFATRKISTEKKTRARVSLYSIQPAIFWQNVRTSCSFFSSFHSCEE